MNNTYVLRADKGSFVPFFKDGGYASMGWFSKDDTFEIEKSNSKSYIKEVLLRSNPESNSRQIGIWAGMVFRFINETKEGDTIMTPTSNNKILIGKILGQAYVEIDNNSELVGRIRKKVEWTNEIEKDLLSDEIRKKLHCNLTFFSVDEYLEDDSEVEEIYAESFVEDIDLSKTTDYGYQYFMVSQTISDVVKIGKANDVQKREFDLLKDRTYGVFKLKTKGWVKTKRPYEMEKLFKAYFNNYRFDIKNGLSIDTELFQAPFNLYELWKKFITTNYINNPVMKNEIVDYHFSE